MKISKSSIQIILLVFCIVNIISCKTTKIKEKELSSKSIRLEFPYCIYGHGVQGKTRHTRAKYYISKEQYDKLIPMDLDNLKTIPDLQNILHSALKEIKKEVPEKVRVELQYLFIKPIKLTGGLITGKVFFDMTLSWQYQNKNYRKKLIILSDGTVIDPKIKAGYK